MIIRSQDRNTCSDFDGVKRGYLDSNHGSLLCIYGMIKDYYIPIGTYKTEERTLEVLNDILQEMGDIEYSRINCTEYPGDIPYRMPKE